MISFSAPLFLVLLAAASSVAAQDADPCDVPGRPGHDLAYERLAGRGRRALAAGRPAEAVRQLQAALAVPLHEAPNFELLPLLAVAYHRSGDPVRASATLERVRLALSVLTGTVRCGAEDGGPPLVERDGRAVASPEAAAAAELMCGDLYEPHYEERTLEDVVRDGELAAAWLRAREEIPR